MWRNFEPIFIKRIHTSSKVLASITASGKSQTVLGNIGFHTPNSTCSKIITIIKIITPNSTCSNALVVDQNYHNIRIGTPRSHQSCTYYYFLLTAISSSWSIKRSPSEPGIAGNLLWNNLRSSLSWFEIKPWNIWKPGRPSVLGLPDGNPYEDLPLLLVDRLVCPHLKAHCKSNFWYSSVIPSCIMMPTSDHIVSPAYPLCLRIQFHNVRLHLVKELFDVRRIVPLLGPWVDD